MNKSELIIKKKQELQNKIREAIQGHILNEFKKNIDEKIEKAWDKYWYLFYDLLEEKKCKCVMNKDFADGNSCVACAEYNKRANEVAEILTELFIEILEDIKETIRKEKENHG